MRWSCASIRATLLRLHWYLRVFTFLFRDADAWKQAPEYALDETLVTSSDMYSLGALIYAVHCQGKPPFVNYDSLATLRANAGRPVPEVSKLDTDLQGHTFWYRYN